MTSNHIIQEQDLLNSFKSRTSSSINVTIINKIIFSIFDKIISIVKNKVLPNIFYMLGLHSNLMCVEKLACIRYSTILISKSCIVMTLKIVVILSFALFVSNTKNYTNYIKKFWSPK